MRVACRGRYWPMRGLAAGLRQAFRWLIVGLIIQAQLLGAVHAQAVHTQSAETYELADGYAAQGNGEKAEQAYDEILRRHPGDRKALIGRATARAWLGEYQLAEADYMEVLRSNSNDLEALTGLGYSYLWAQQHSEAERTFKRSLAAAPDNVGAQKGLGYAYLWSDRPGFALAVFQKIAETNPSDAEVQSAIAQAELQQGHARRAVRAYKDALKLEPSRTDAVQGLRAAYGAPALLELSLWGGTASGGGATGLRLVELATWINPQTRIWARFDNSLSLDNPALVRANLDARTYYGGITRKFGEDWLGLAEFGYRDLPAGANQQIYKSEIIHLDEGRAAKLGGQISPHSGGYIDELVYAGYGFSLSDGWRIEPTIFYSNSGGANDDEWRGVAFAEYRSPSGWSLGAGAGGGYLDSTTPGVSGEVWVANALASVPIGGYHSLYGSLRYEDNPSSNFLIAMFGVTLRLPHN